MPAKHDQRILSLGGILAEFFLCLTIFSLIFPAALLAQSQENDLDGAGKQTYSISASTVFQLGSSINGGGSLSLNSYYVSATYFRKINDKWGVGIGALYNLDDFRFSDLTAIPIATPWDKIQSYGLGIPISYSPYDQWQVVVIPVAQYAGESGARWGDAIAYGGVVSATYTVGPGSYIGLGVGAFSNIEEIDVFPYIAVNVQLTDKFRLSNPLQASPSGPAGLKLSYALNKNWEVGIAGAYRFNRFRLDKNGPIPNGVGQYSRLPVVANIAYTYSLLTLNLYGGVSFNNNVWLENSNGNGIYRADQHPAPLVGFSLTFGMEPSQFRLQPGQVDQFRKLF